MARHIISTLVLWAGLTAIGEAAVFLNLFPTVGSHEAEEFDRIFRILLFMGIPVFTFVISVVTYSFFVFRVKGRDGSAGPAFRGTGAVPRIWLAITGSLAILVMIYPGLTGLAKLQSDGSGYGWGKTEGELTVKVTGFRFSWQFDYPDGTQLVGPGKELVLPVNTDIKFEVGSVDVVHSFWIPAFRMKIDAIPGRTTFMTVHPVLTGEFATDAAYRVQCAELCGLNHTDMSYPVRVVEKAEFEHWLAAQPKPGDRAQGR
jgi:cytochrome c oxidase subunit 2